MALWTFDSTSTTLDSTVATWDGSAGSGAGAALAGTPSDAITAAAGLINFASVTLVAPLYTGIGGIFDPNLVWPFSTPVVGSVVKYDPTFITVLPNGEIVSTANNIAAEVQYNDGTNLNEIDVFITPNMVGYAFDTSSAQGTLGGAVALAAAATNLSSATGALTTGIQLVAAASDVMTAVGALNTAILLAAAANDALFASGSLSGIAAAMAGTATDTSSAGGALTTPQSQALAGAATDTSAASAALSTQIALAGAAADVLTAVGALTTKIQLAAQAADTSSAAGAIKTNVLFVGAATDSITAAGLLGSIQMLQAAANDVITAGGALITKIVLSATATSTSIAAGGLSTQTRLSGAAQTAVTATADLGVLALNLRPSRLITIGYYSNSLLGTAGPLPYGEFYSRVDDVEIYAIDWTGWLTSFWERGGMNLPGDGIRPTAPNGYQFITALGGQSGNFEPIWPNVIGQTVQDGSTVWTCEAIDNSTLFAVVNSAAWKVPTGIVIKGQEQSGQLTLAEVDSTGAAVGRDYPVNVEATMSDGETKVGQILLKVR